MAPRGHAVRIGVKATFFEGDAADRCDDVIDRSLPFMSRANLELIATGAQRRDFAFGRIVAQPDGLFRHGKGLISVEYKSRSKRTIAEDRWIFEVQLDNMLQCILGGLVVAQQMRKAVACVLRYHNAALLVTPSRAVVQEVWSLVPMACRYYEDRRVASFQLGHFAADRVRMRIPGPRDLRSDAGRAAHEAMFRPNQESRGRSIQREDV
jgi:hypothetical protein